MELMQHDHHGMMVMREAAVGVGYGDGIIKIVDKRGCAPRGRHQNLPRHAAAQRNR